MNEKIYKAFISSPSDTGKERNICKNVLEEINKSLGDIYNFRIEPLMWEENVRPRIAGNDPQMEIFDQIGDNFEIFIGILKTKFGTETKRAGSGTEEEFNKAFERKKNIEIIFYFSDEQIRPSEQDTNELIKINKFKDKIKGHGIYGTYKDTDEFKKKLKEDLENFIKRQYKEEKKEVEIHIKKKGIIKNHFQQKI